jgi:hypothetical protein
VDKDKIRSYFKGLDEYFYSSMRKEHLAANNLAALAIGMKGGIEDEGPSAEIVNARTIYFARRCGYTPGIHFNPAAAAAELPMIAEHARQTWYLEKAAGAFGLELYGPNSCLVKEILAGDANTNLPVLFAAFIDSVVMESLLANSLVPQLVYTSQVINSFDYQAVEVDDEDRPSIVPDASDLPLVKIQLTEHSIRAIKFGRTIEASYDAMMYQRVDVIRPVIARAVRRIGIDETNLALTALYSGDAPSDANGVAASVTTSAVTGTLQWEDFISLGVAFNDGYNADVGVMGATMIADTMGLTEFRTPQSATIQVIAGIPNPLHVRWLKWTDAQSPIAADRLMQLDNRRALIEVQAAGLLQEEDRVITSQVRRFAISKRSGYVVADQAATKVLDVTH